MRQLKIDISMCVSIGNRVGGKKTWHRRKVTLNIQIFANFE